MSSAAMGKRSSKPGKTAAKLNASTTRVTLPPSEPPEVASVDVAERIPPFPIRPLAVAQFEYLVNLGFFGDAPVEMLDGFVVDKMTHGSFASTIISRLTRLLTRALAESLIVRTQLPLRLQRSVPEPDLAIVAGPDARYLEENPKADDAFLVIEVSDSTLAKDRGPKLRDYASNGIREYWIVNCVDRSIEVYTSPSASSDEPRYKKKTVLRLDETAKLRIQGHPALTIPLAMLFG